MKGETAEVYNICLGHPRTILSVLEELIYRSGEQVAIEVASALLKYQDVERIYGESCELSA